MKAKVLWVATILSGIGGFVTLLEFVLNHWEVTMKFDAWLFSCIIFSTAFVACIIIGLNEFRKDYKKIRQLVCQLFLESESKKLNKAVDSAIQGGGHQAFEELKKKS